ESALVAHQGQLEAVAVGVCLQRTHIGAIQRGVVENLQGGAGAVAQPAEAQAGEVDAVLGDIEVGDVVGVAGGAGAMAVGEAGEAEQIGAVATTQTVLAGAALENVGTGSAIECVGAGETEQSLVGRGAVEGVVAGAAPQNDALAWVRWRVVVE